MPMGLKVIIFVTGENCAGKGYRADVWVFVSTTCTRTNSMGQARQAPRLPEELFLDVVYGAVDVDLLLITGLRDEAPVIALPHLLPDSRPLEVRLNASKETRR
ncbi:hypothetical protein BJ170DRAFT_685318 [Xylariales sp. AK1849]|nr:hypothetical protein BJ170DRAFT_685318 [Xylariales sp. AK1849]